MKKVLLKIHGYGLGDTLCSTAALRKLSRAYDCKISVKSKYPALFKNNPYVDSNFILDEGIDESEYEVFSCFEKESFFKNSNIESHRKIHACDRRRSCAFDLGFDLLDEELTLDFFADEYCKYDIKSLNNYVCLHTTSNWKNRTWAEENWQNLTDKISELGYNIVIIGKDYLEPTFDGTIEKKCFVPKGNNIFDYTNDGSSISDMWHLINHSICIITMDSGPLHIAGTTDAWIIQVGSASDYKYINPVRKKSRDYKYKFVGGECKIFCTSDIKYSVKEWNSINFIPYLPECLEKYNTFKCHPNYNQVLEKFKEIDINSIDKSKQYPKINYSEIKMNNVYPFKKQKFGIYTSFYNAEEFIDSIFDQISKINYDNFEWIITDDFSSDNTKSKLLEKVKYFKNVKYVEQSHKKEMYWQPNKFFDSSFDYVVLIDCDDEFDLDFLNIYNKYALMYPDALFITSEFIKTENNNFHSLSLVKNNENLLDNLSNFHSEVDYLNNISYYAFSHLRCFKNTKEINFQINDFDAGAEDSYRAMILNSLGKWLHIPRCLYNWKLRYNSESHSSVKSNFNGNFNLAYNKLKINCYDPYYIFNDIYKETSGMSILGINLLHNKSICIVSKDLNPDQKNKLKNLYSDCKVDFDFNNKCDFYLIVCDYYLNSNFIKNIVDRIKSVNSSAKIILYYLEYNHFDNKIELNKVLDENFLRIQNQVSNYSYRFYRYIRHNYIIL
jgi:ADP-heptose:LPS heptosyltransferase